MAETVNDRPAYKVSFCYYIQAFVKMGYYSLTSEGRKK